MELIILLIFIFGYLAIVFEHQLRIDKLIPALTMMAFSWVVIALNLSQISTWFDVEHGKIIQIIGFSLDQKKALLDSTLLHHFGKTAEILVFLMGAMVAYKFIEGTNYGTI